MASTLVQIVPQGSCLDFLPCLLSVMDCDLKVKDKLFLPQSCFCSWCFLIAVEVLREVPPVLNRQAAETASDCYCL